MTAKIWSAIWECIVALQCPATRRPVQLVPSCPLNAVQGAWVLSRARLANKIPSAALAVSVDFCPMTLALSNARSLPLHVSSRVWACRSMSESAVLPRLSATQNHARPFQPVTQTQNPCPLVQHSTRMIDVISSECVHDARVLRCARLAIPSPTLAVCADFSPVIRARACSALQVSRHAACTTRNTA